MSPSRLVYHCVVLSIFLVCDHGLYENRVQPVLGDVSGLACFITIDEKLSSNTDCYLVSSACAAAVKCRTVRHDLLRKCGKGQITANALDINCVGNAYYCGSIAFECN